MPKVLFLPGAGGSPTFWTDVADHLPSTWEKIHFGWPGLGDQPHCPSITCLDDLVALVEAQIDDVPVDLVAQSMGGVIAARVALARPDVVRRLVLVVTSGGVDMTRFGATDWRPDYCRQYPSAAKWILRPDSAGALPIERISVPTLLIWGDADEISPVAVGRHLEQRMLNAKLQIMPDGDHDIALTKADLVAALVKEHLS